MSLEFPQNAKTKAATWSRYITLLCAHKETKVDIQWGNVCHHGSQSTTLVIL